MTDLRLRISIIEKNDRDSEVELVRKTLQFKPRTTALDACAQIREHLSEIKSLGQSTQYGLFLPDEDPKKGVWLEPGRTLEHYLLRDNDALEYRRKIRVLKVRMMDGAVKAIMVDDSQIVSNLMVIICTKIGITNHDEYSLVLNKTEAENETVTSNRFGTIGGTLTIRKTKHRDGDKEVDPKMDELKKQLKTEDGVNWVDHGRTLREQGIIESDILLLKRKYFFSDANIDSRDPIQLNLLYEQAREGILDGTHPVTQNVAEEFAALQFQIQFGDYKESTHKSGIIDLKEFLPQSYIRSRNIEKKIIEKHKKLMGLSEVDSKVEYVKLARGLKTFGVWAASPNVFTLDFGDYQDQYYSVQTTEGEQISQLIAGYIDIILKKRNWKERIGDDGNEEEAMEEDIVAPGRAITIVGLPGAANQKVEASNVAKPGLLRNSNGASQAVLKDSTMESKYNPILTIIVWLLEALVQNIPRNILLLDPKELYQWKETQKNTNKQTIHSQVSAMNAATAQMVTLTGQGEETDHNAVGAAVNTISNNLPEMAKGVKLLAALMDDEGADGDDLMGAAKNLCTAFTDLLAAAEPESKEPRQTMLSAASQVGSASHRVLYTIGEEEVEEKERQDILLGLAKAVANTTAALVLKAKNVASKCTDQQTQNKVIGAATQCALGTSQLVACAKVVAPTINDPQCQDQLVEASKEVAKSVEGCVITCRDVCTDESSLKELGHSAADVTRALNDLLNHVKDGHPDRIPDIMEQILTASSELIASCESTEMVRQARILAQSTAELIQAIKGEAEVQSDTDIQKRLLSAAKDLADATARMVEAAKSCASNPNSNECKETLRNAAENLRMTTHAAVGTTIKRKLIKRLENASKHAAASATQCIAASQGAGSYNMSHTSQEDLMDSCKNVAEVIPKLVDSVKVSMQNPDGAMAQINLITNAEKFLDPSQRLLESTKSTLPTINNESSILQLSNSSKQLNGAVKDLRTCITKAHQVCGSLEIEASRDVITFLTSELEEFRVSAKRFDLRPLPGETTQNASFKLNTACKSVGSTVAQLITAASEGNQDITNRAARETANALRDYTAAVRVVAASTDDPPRQNRIIDNAQLFQIYLDKKKISETIDEIDVLDQKINSESYVSSGKPYHELQSQLSSAADKLNEATSDVIQSAPQPNRLVASSKHFGKVLEEMMECSMDMAGQTKIQNTRTSMVSTMRNVTNSSTTFLTSAKNVSTNPSAPNANNLAVAARGVTDSINNLINVYTSAAPGQKECDNAVRAIQSCRHHVQKNSTFPLSNLTYYECLDAVMEKSKALGDGMTGIANHAKKSDHEEFGASVTNVSEAICGLIEAAVQSAYLVGIADINSTTGKKGIAIKQACKNLTDSHSQSGQEQILSSATVIATHTSAVCNSCRVIASKTTNPVTKRHFVQSAKEVANATATLVKEIKQLDANYTEENHRRTTEASKPLIESMDSLCQFVMSPEFTSVPSKISEEGTKAQGPILESSSHIIEGSCSMIHSAKSLAINPKDPPTWQSLANSSKDVSDSIKRLVSAIRDKSPGQKECEDGIEKLTLHIQELDQISVAAIHQNLTPRRDKDIKQFTEQMENAASQISNKLPELQNAAKNEAERLGHCVSSMMTYFDPLVKNSIGCSSNMVSSKQQVSTLDQTKTVAECAQQLLYAAKEGGGNPKAVHAHADIDESVEAMKDSIQFNCITEAIFTVQDYRTTASIHVGGDSNFVSYQSRMMSSTKEIARTAQEIVIKSTNESHKLGDLASHLSSHYQMLANDSKEACICTSNADMGERIRSTVQELGQSTIELVKSAGSCQITPHDSFSLRDVSDHARNVGEKCSLVLSSLNAASTGTHALENATNTVSGIIGDLDTTIMFASSGTLNADVDDDTFADHRENILKTAKALVEDTKTLVAGAASSQEQLAVAAQNAVSTIIQLSDVVKSGASSLGSPNREAQVMLINAVKDVASALSDLMQSTKAASGKNIQDPSMHQLKDSAKVMVTNVTSLLKTVKAVEDEHTRGTRALESAIEAIAQEIRAYDTDGPPKFKAEPEDLIRATRPITIATGKAASAGKSCKQEDVIVAANMGRKAISDMLSSCKSAAYYSEKPEIRSRALRAGREVAVQYRELLQLVLSSLNRPSGTSTMSSDLTNISRKIAQCVTELATSAELLKDDDWVDPSDPTVIAENELFGAAKSIENAAAKLASLKPRKEVKGKEIDLSMNFDELILDAAKSIAAATAALI
ncbi:TLN [Lepeophtheirus salmonis]|uniref:TLN n=1 Tax=Lepeophtheirus salmonis TaxID=72036 RepID=A0A7R8CBL0_LEPSM|nr:TLN [Lepeophtheirus salmonis]CAF2761759.1 TLN [Lepeophtheirus salmonis]